MLESFSSRVGDCTMKVNHEATTARSGVASRMKMLLDTCHGMLPSGYTERRRRSSVTTASRPTFRPVSANSTSAFTVKQSAIPPTPSSSFMSYVHA
jgi:hypothetical protein